MHIDQKESDLNRCHGYLSFSFVDRNFFLLLERPRIVLLHSSFTMLANIPPGFSNESPSTPSSYVSLLDTSGLMEEFLDDERILIFVDTSIISLPSSQGSTVYWSDTFDAIRQWSSRKLKFTRQFVQERIGQSMKTHDFELEKSIAVR